MQGPRIADAQCVALVLTDEVKVQVLNPSYVNRQRLAKPEWLRSFFEIALLPGEENRSKENENSE